jgi:hypothetical protein
MGDLMGMIISGFSRLARTGAGGIRAGSIRASLAIVACLSLTLATSAALAQTNTMPPALRAAVNSGSPDAVRNAIASLAAGNPERVAALADLVVKAAEQTLQTNPKTAIALAGAAVSAVNQTPVQTAAPAQAGDVLTTAARIFISPGASVLPESVTLATSVLAAATNSNNAALIANVAQQSVSLAEKTLQSNPSAAVALAAASVGAVSSQTVQNSAPQQSLEVASAAARVAVKPEAQNANPQAAANISTAASQVVSNPTVYQTSPTAALQTMADSYATATSTAVTSASPTTAATVTQTLNQASTNTALNNVNTSNASQVNSILARNTAVSNTNNQLPPSDTNRNVSSPT